MEKFNQTISDIRHKHFNPLYQALNTYIGLANGFRINAKCLKGIRDRVQRIEEEILNLAKED